MGHHIGFAFDVGTACGGVLVGKVWVQECDAASGDDGIARLERDVGCFVVLFSKVLHDGGKCMVAEMDYRRFASPVLPKFYWRCTYLGAQAFEHAYIGAPEAVDALLFITYEEYLVF